jgi:hypothetical protein
MPRENDKRMEQRVARAAAAALAERKLVTPVDVLVGLGWLAPSRVDEWRQGRVKYPEAVTIANLGKISTAMRSFRRWAQRRGLKPSETAYRARTRDMPAATRRSSSLHNGLRCLRHCSPSEPRLTPESARTPRCRTFAPMPRPPARARASGEQDRPRRPPPPADEPGASREIAGQSCS